jgi:hypothetical protein
MQRAGRYTRRFHGPTRHTDLHTASQLKHAYSVQCKWHKGLLFIVVCSLLRFFWSLTDFLYILTGISQVITTILQIAIRKWQFCIRLATPIFFPCKNSYNSKVSQRLFTILKRCTWGVAYLWIKIIGVKEKVLNLPCPALITERWNYTSFGPSQ